MSDIGKNIVNQLQRSGVKLTLFNGDVSVDSKSTRSLTEEESLAVETNKTSIVEYLESLPTASELGVAPKTISNTFRGVSSDTPPPNMVGNTASLGVYSINGLTGGVTFDYVSSVCGNTGDVSVVCTFNGATGAIEGVNSVNGVTGNVYVVSSFNGLTGNVQAITGVSSVNGATGAVVFTDLVGVNTWNGLSGDVDVSNSTVEIGGISSGGGTITAKIVSVGTSVESKLLWGKASGLSCDGDANFGSGIKASAGATFGGTLFVSEPATFENTVEVAEIVTAQGFQSVSSAGSSFDGYLSVGGDFTVSGGATLGGDVNITGSGNHLQFPDGTTQGTAHTQTEEIIGVHVDNGSSVLTTGTKGHRVLPYDCEVTEWTVTSANTGDIDWDVNWTSYANFPSGLTSVAGSDLPNIPASGDKNQDTSVGWSTTTFNAGDILQFEIDSVTTLTNCNLALKIRRTS